VIGFLTAASPRSPYLDALREGLAVEGYVEGRNLTIEARGADGQHDRLPALAAELVARPVDAIATGGGMRSLWAAKRATEKIPIVALMGADPVAASVVDSLSRPGGNVTGVAQLVNETEGKRLQLLHELVPAQIRQRRSDNLFAMGRLLRAADRPQRRTRR
jgi:putative ABC transport system substrate-binding protein